MPYPANCGHILRLESKVSVIYYCACPSKIAASNETKNKTQGEK